MNTTKSRNRWLFFGFSLLVVAIGVAWLQRWPATTHPSLPASLGQPSSTAALEAIIEEPGPISVETIIGADWQVDRGGLINLDHPTAKAAGLKDGPEPIQIYIHALHHPSRGLFLVDSGIERALESDREHAAVRGLVAKGAHLELLRVHTTTGAWLAARGETPNGVLLTHLHLDHVLGIPDLPSSVTVYLGAGEVEARGMMNVLLAPVVDRTLAGKGPLQTWRFAADPSHLFASVVDVFGDRSLFALWVPGHTKGSTAYLARTPNGPVLFTGDACHTAWGWEHGVEPGSFSNDRPASAESLRQLRALVARHPRIDVRLGHQSLSPAAERPSLR